MSPRPTLEGGRVDLPYYAEDECYVCGHPISDNQASLTLSWFADRDDDGYNLTLCDRALCLRSAGPQLRRALRLAR